MALDRSKTTSIQVIPTGGTVLNDGVLQVGSNVTLGAATQFKEAQ